MSNSTPGPLFYRPDPSKPSWVAGKCERVERRGPGHFVIVGKRLDDRPAEARLAPIRFKMRGPA